MWNPARCGVGAGVQGASPSMFCIMAVGIKHSRYVALAASAWSALTLRHSGLWWRCLPRQISITWQSWLWCSGNGLSSSPTPEIPAVPPYVSHPASPCCCGEDSRDFPVAGDISWLAGQRCHGTPKYGIQVASLGYISRHFKNCVDQRFVVLTFTIGGCVREAKELAWVMPAQPCCGSHPPCSCREINYLSPLKQQWWAWAAEGFPYHFNWHIPLCTARHIDCLLALWALLSGSSPGTSLPVPRCLGRGHISSTEHSLMWGWCMSQSSPSCLSAWQLQFRQESLRCSKVRPPESWFNSITPWRTTVL